MSCQCLSSEHVSSLLGGASIGMPSESERENLRRYATQKEVDALERRLEALEKSIRLRNASMERRTEALERTQTISEATSIGHCDKVISKHPPDPKVPCICLVWFARGAVRCSRCLCLQVPTPVASSGWCFILHPSRVRLQISTRPCR